MNLIMKSFPAKRISFDSTHEGQRGIYMVEMEPVRQAIQALK